MDTPNRLAASGSDQQGHNILAGKDADGRHVRILISDFQSAYDRFRLEISNLPWDDATPFTPTRAKSATQKGWKHARKRRGCRRVRLRDTVWCRPL